MKQTATTLTACLAALCAAAAVVAPPAAAERQFTYTVQSDAPLLSASFYDGMDNMQTLTNLPTSWTQTFNSQATYQFHSISTQTNGTQVMCQITVDGALADRKSATGRYAVVTCSG